MLLLSSFILILDGPTEWALPSYLLLLYSTEGLLIVDEGLDFWDSLEGSKYFAKDRPVTLAEDYFLRLALLVAESFLSVIF
jgi:hypothetical protein